MITLIFTGCSIGCYKGNHRGRNCHKTRDQSANKKGVFIADFGCATGNNSFSAMEIITQAINRKYESTESHVFFVDLATNDFNTLFTSLSPQRSYHAVAIGGDLHRCLLPRSSLHFAYSSWSLHWLLLLGFCCLESSLQVPKAVEDVGSPAWNKGEILYSRERKEVRDAYLDQYTKDMGAFLESRAIEMVGGGLMALLVPAVCDHKTQFTAPYISNDVVRSCLMDMAKKGRLSEEKIDSFNLPYYFATPQELKSILERNTSFSIERMEILDNPGKYILPSVNARISLYRAVHERLFTQHFGGEITGELFDLFELKLAALPLLLNPENDKSIVILAILKRT